MPSEEYREILFNGISEVEQAGYLCTNYQGVALLIAIKRFTPTYTQHKVSQSTNQSIPHGSKAITKKTKRKRAQLTIQFPHSSILLVIISTCIPCAVSKFLSLTACANSTILCTVSSFNRSSLLRWSKRMFRRFSVSLTCALKEAGALAFTRCMS